MNDHLAFRKAARVGLLVLGGVTGALVPCVWLLLSFMDAPLYWWGLLGCFFNEGLYNVVIVLLQAALVAPAALAYL